MALHEKYGTRDLTYSQWHRKQGRHLAMIDIDDVEWCVFCKEPLALIETAQDVGQNFKSTRVTRKLAEKAGLPAYLVYYKVSGDDIEQFRVNQVSPNNTDEVLMLPEQYREFLCCLRDAHYDEKHSGASSRGY